MINGAHLPNGPLRRADMTLFEKGDFRAAKLLCTAGTQHKQSDVLALRLQNPSCDFVLRLPDSRRADGTFYNSDQYAGLCASIINSFYQVGVRDYQVDNEPNWLWVYRGYGPWQYRYMMRLALEKLRGMIPADVRLIAPPLSFSSALWQRGPSKLNPSPYSLDDWVAAFVSTDGGEVKSLWQMFDLAGVNAYWQSPEQMIDPSYGGCFEQVHRKSGGLPVCIVEYGNSKYNERDEHSNMVHSLTEREEAMSAQYPAYVAWLRGYDYVESAHVFLVGGTAEWAGFQLTEKVAEAMAPHRRAKRPNGAVAV